MSANSQHQTCFEFYWRSTFLSPLDQELILDWFYQSIPGEYCSRDRQKSFRGNKSGDVQPWQSFHPDLWCYWTQVTTLVKAQRERKVRETAIDKQKWNKKNETKTKRKLKTGEERGKRNGLTSDWSFVKKNCKLFSDFSFSKGKICHFCCFSAITNWVDWF